MTRPSTMAPLQWGYQTFRCVSVVWIAFGRQKPRELLEMAFRFCWYILKPNSMDKFLMICYINEQILFIYFCEPLLLVAKCRPFSSLRCHVRWAEHCRCKNLPTTWSLIWTIFWPNPRRLAALARTKNHPSWQFWLNMRILNPWFILPLTGWFDESVLACQFTFLLHVYIYIYIHMIFVYTYNCICICIYISIYLKIRHTCTLINSPGLGCVRKRCKRRSRAHPRWGWLLLTAIRWRYNNFSLTTVYIVYIYWIWIPLTISTTKRVNTCLVPSSDSWIIQANFSAECTQGWIWWIYLCEWA